MMVGAESDVDLIVFAEVMFGLFKRRKGALIIHLNTTAALFIHPVQIRIRVGNHRSNLIKIRANNLVDQLYLSSNKKG